MNQTHLEITNVGMLDAHVNFYLCQRPRTRDLDPRIDRIPGARASSVGDPDVSIVFQHDRLIAFVVGCPVAQEVPGTSRGHPRGARHFGSTSGRGSKLGRRRACPSGSLRFKAKDLAQKALSWENGEEFALIKMIEVAARLMGV